MQYALFTRWRVTWLELWPSCMPATSLMGTCTPTTCWQMKMANRSCATTVRVILCSAHVAASPPGLQPSCCKPTKYLPPFSPLSTTRGLHHPSRCNPLLPLLPMQSPPLPHRGCDCRLATKTTLLCSGGLFCGIALSQAFPPSRIVAFPHLLPMQAPPYRLLLPRHPLLFQPDFWPQTLQNRESRFGFSSINVHIVLPARTPASPPPLRLRAVLTCPRLRFPSLSSPACFAPVSSNQSH